MSKSVYIKILLWVVLVLTVACGKEVDTPSPVPEAQTVHYKATVQTGADTRATVGEDLKYVFEEGDRIYMESKNGNLYGFLTMSFASGAGNDAALFEGDLIYVGEGVFPNDNPEVTLVLVSKNDDLHKTEGGKLAAVNKDSYLQDKWAPSLEEAVSRLSHFTGSGHFDDKRFTLIQNSSFLKCSVRIKTDEAPVNSTVTAKLFNNNSETPLRTASVTVEKAGSVPFVFAFPGGETSLSEAELYVKWGESEASFPVADHALAANNYYSLSRSALSYDGFQIRAISNSTTIYFNYNYEDSGIEYSLEYGEPGTWIHYDGPFTINAGDIACIRGNRTNYKNEGPANKPIFYTNNKKCYISGNIMSLLADKESLVASAFQGAFSKGSSVNNNDIDIDPESDLILPVTTLASQCYMQMFYRCTKLTKTPVFSAEVVAYRCCYGMFYQCSALVSASGIKLPAMTLAQDCYRELFRKCSSLTTVPDLPATELATTCYHGMFRECGSLLSVKCYINVYNGVGDKSQKASYDRASMKANLDKWMYGVPADGGTFYCHPDMVQYWENARIGSSGLWYSGDNQFASIGQNWTVSEWSTYPN